eukprot:9354607-Alexandrium_andersonii.AAC.1
MTIVVDEGSALIQIFEHGSRDLGGSVNRTTQVVTDCINQWIRFYGKPALVRMDSEGCHVSRAMQDFMDRQGI